MNSRSRCLAIAAFAFVSSSFGFAQDVMLPERYFPQLEAIIADAVRQSPRMLDRNLNLISADGELIQARAGLYPSASGYIQSSKTRDQREDASGTLKTDKLYYSFTVTQPLFHWGERRNTARIGEIRHQIAQHQYGEAYRALALEIRRSYLRLIVIKARLAASRYSQIQAEEALRLAEAKLANRVISESEIFTPQIALDRARLTTDQAEDDLLEERRLFHNLTGQPAPDDHAIPDQIPSPMSVADGANRLLAVFLSQGEPQTPEARIRRAELSASKLTYANQRTRLRPKFSIVAGISQDEQRYTANLAPYGLKSQYVGIQGTWQIFDGFAARGAQKSSLAQVRGLEANYRRYTEEVASTAQSAARQLAFAERQAQIQEKVFGSTHGFLELRKEQFRNGVASESDVAAAQAAYNDGFVSALAARQALLLRAAEFVSLIAEDPALNNLPAHLR